MRRLFVLLLLPSLLLLAPRARAEVIERVVAKVNGQIITLSDFQARQLAAAQAAHVDPENVGAFLRQNNAKILQQAVDEMLVLQKAEDEGLKIPPQYVDEAIDSIKKENNITSEEQFQDALRKEGLTLGELRQDIDRGMLRRMVVEREIRPKIEVSETELRAEYDKLKATEFTKPPTVSLQEILVKEDAGGLGLAKEIVAKARAGGDFQQLARTYSAAPSKANGGDIGDVVEGDMSPELAKLARELPVGGVSDPMPVAEGFRILKVTAKTAGSTTPFEAARDRIRERIMAARSEKEYEAYTAELRKNASVDLYVREVPLHLTGPIPEGSLLEALDPGTSAAPAPAAPQTPGQPSAAPPPGVGEDEIQTTPQAAPEHVAPPPAPAEKPKDAPPPGR